MSTPPTPLPDSRPYKRYFRRGKVTAYRDQFMLADGKIMDGERFTDIKRQIDFTDARWHDADTGEELSDFVLCQSLEAKYQEGR